MGIALVTSPHRTVRAMMKTVEVFLHCLRKFLRTYQYALPPNLPAPWASHTGTNLRLFMRQESLLLETLGKVRAERWDQPALQGMSDWIMETDIHDSEMCRLYIEDRALQPHLWSLDHTAVIFHIDEYARSLPGLPGTLWFATMTLTGGSMSSKRLTQIPPGFLTTFVLKPKFRGAEAEILLQSIFSTVGKWDQMIAGQWKRNDSLFLCSPTPVRYQINRNRKFD
ncbi:hypothetical protein M422DRAFT_249752 [Sphaerobolus stellatus SS14]|uniref:Uncharacterized protein n=1 Tax=Sphaerobolus stellatus (strain SS14) TaxID=990650 RepID=A0A0C9VH94_SPHS4|nr:hypothetical protein M422DRAFT_249752 [Sphaerobolus stellatus SS14]